MFNRKVKALKADIEWLNHQLKMKDYHIELLEKENRRLSISIKEDEPYKELSKHFKELAQQNVELKEKNDFLKTSVATIIRLNYMM